MTFTVTMVQKTIAQYHGLQAIYMEDYVTCLAAPQPTTRKQEQNKASRRNWGKGWNLRISKRPKEGYFNVFTFEDIATKIIWQINKNAGSAGSVTQV